ncbi:MULTISPECIES: hypothetical protein [Nitrosomonas]|uniref:hypothetical protein n=1 Tax=Nitrosomonas TaxID=914 RepID=UPI0033905B94
MYAGLLLEIAAMEKLVHTGSILPLNLVVIRITFCLMTIVSTKFRCLMFYQVTGALFQDHQLQ